MDQKARSAHLFARAGSVLLALLSAGFLCAAKAGLSYVHTSWNTEKGLPSDTVIALAQTRDGFLWIGGEEGLVRFDGLRMELFNRDNTPEFQDHYVRSLRPDAAGGLWVGTIGGELFRVAERRFERRLGREQTGGRSILLIRPEGPDAALISLTGGGLLRAAAGASLVPLRPGEVLDAAEGPAGVLWIAGDTGLRILRDGVETVLVPAGWKSGDRFTAVCADGAGGAWAGTAGGGLYRLRDGRLNPYPGPAGWGRKAINSLLRDGGSGLWLGTNGNGAWRIAEGGAAAAEEAYVPGAIVNRLIEDAEGTIWIATSGSGLHALRESRISVLAAPQGLTTETVLPVLESRDGRIWAGTAGGGLFGYEKGRFTHYGAAQGFPGELVFSLAEDRDGGLWAASAGGNLTYFKDGRFRPVVCEEGEFPSRLFRSVFADRDGTVWVGTNGGGLLRGREGRVRPVPTIEALRKARIFCFAQDDSGMLWIGTDGSGLFGRRPSDGEFVRFGAAEGLPGNIIDAIVPGGRAGSLWVATGDAGLARLAGGRITSLGLANGLFDRVILQLLDDGRGSFWMTSNRGISRVAQKDLEEAADTNGRVTAFVYGKDDGLLSAECNGGIFPAGIRARDGRLWIPTMKGLAVIDPARFEERPSPFPPVVEGVLADHRPVPAGTEKLPPGVSRLEFRFTRPAFRGADQIRFRYRLDGYDRGWQDAGTARTASYTNLPPRVYAFRVEATDRHRRWSPGQASLRIALAPRFTQTWLFTALCILGVGGLLAGLYRSHLRKRHEKDLIVQVAERTREIKRSLDDQKKLVFELQHRVRNNLQTILALLEPLPDSRGLRSARERILTLASVQEAVQASPDLIHLNMSGLLRSVVAALAGRRPGSPRPTVAVAAAAAFPLEAASAVALIAHEWTANAMDHAFPGREAAAPPAITVRLNPLGPDWRLTVEDNGAGFPEADSAPRRESGLALAALLAAQLGGRVSRSGPGTGWTLDFPDPESEERA